MGLASVAIAAEEIAGADAAAGRGIGSISALAAYTACLVAAVGEGTAEEHGGGEEGDETHDWSVVGSIFGE